MSWRQLVDRFIFPLVAVPTGLLLRLYPCKRHLRALAAHLVVDEEPQPSDIIAILGGGSIGRARTGAALFKRGLAASVYLSTDVDPAELAGSGAKTSHQWLLREGVPPAAILHDRRPRTTSDEAECFADCARRFGWRAALVVTDPYHTRRAVQTFRRALTRRGVGVDLRCVSVAPGAAALDEWWTSRKARAFVISEYVTLLLYRVLGRL